MFQLLYISVWEWTRHFSIIMARYRQVGTSDYQTLSTVFNDVESDIDRVETLIDAANEDGDSSISAIAVENLKRLAKRMTTLAENTEPTLIGW